MPTPSATFVISSTLQVTPSIEIYDVTGDVFDGSGTYDGTSFGVGDVVFDSSAFGSYRWKIISVEDADPSTPTYRVEYDDEGAPPFEDVGPAAGAGAVCGTASDGLYKVAQSPALSINETFGFTEVLYTAIQNANDRGTDRAAATIEGGEGSSNIKMMFNDTGVTIAPGKPVAKLVDGSIALVDSDDPAKRQFVGITTEAILDQTYGPVQMPWKNMPGVLTGLGFTTTDNVFMGQTPGTYAQGADLTGDDDQVTKVGIADCADGVMSGTATDLLLFVEVLGGP